jgi:serine/threonine-protein kinase
VTGPEPGGADRTDEIPRPAPDGPAPGELLAGRYLLGRQLGAGGMSRVFLAHDRDLDRTVAVKVLAGADGDVARLRDEARAAASVDHPGVVTVHDVGTSPAGVHVVMSYLEGESLAQRLDRDGPLTPEAAAAVGVAVCDALGAAHAAGIVHRDVTPANIMLGPDGDVTVTDFGIARIGEGAGRTATGYIIGTPSYIAPEQARGTDRLDGRADLYALGCCLFAALTGRPPFTDPDPMAVVLAHIRETPPRPSALRDGVPPALERTILRSLAKEPDRRHRDPAAMAAELATVSGQATARDRTQELPRRRTGGEHGTVTMPAPRAPEPGHGAVERAVTEAEDDDGAASDRRRTAGLVVLALAVLLVLGVLAATLLL